MLYQPPSDLAQQMATTELALYLLQAGAQHLQDDKDRIKAVTGPKLLQDETFIIQGIHGTKSSLTKCRFSMGLSTLVVFFAQC